MFLKIRLLFFFPLLFIVSCASFPTQITKMPEIKLENDKFKVVKRVSSTCSTDYFLCFQLNNPNYGTRAFNELYLKAQGKGKSRAIIDMTIDQSFITLLIWSRMTIGLSGTVIEFVDPSQKSDIPLYEDEKDEIDKPEKTPVFQQVPSYGPPPPPEGIRRNSSTKRINPMDEQEKQAK